MKISFLKNFNSFSNFIKFGTNFSNPRLRASKAFPEQPAPPKSLILGPAFKASDEAQVAGSPPLAPTDLVEKIRLPVTSHLEQNKICEIQSDLEFRVTEHGPGAVHATPRNVMIIGCPMKHDLLVQVGSSSTTGCEEHTSTRHTTEGNTIMICMSSSIAALRDAS